MKRFVALVGGSLFLFGLPFVLISTGMVPSTVASAFANAIAMRDPMELGTQAGLFGLWSTWIWGFGSVIFDVVRTWGSRHNHSVGAMSSRYSLLFVVALWSILFMSRPSPAAARQTESEQVAATIDDTAHEHLYDAVPLALGSSVVLLAGLLTHIGILREKQLRLAPSGSFMPPMSQRAAFTWGELRHRYRAQHADRFDEATQEIPNSGTGFPFVQVPIGISANETVVVALAPGTRFDIVAADIEAAKTAARHLIAVAQITAKANGIQVIIEKATNLDALDQLNEESCDNSESKNVAVIRVIIDLRQDDDELSTVVAKNEAVVKICVLSDNPNRMQLDTSGWVLMPTNQRLAVFGLTEFETSAVHELLSESSKPAVRDIRKFESVSKDWKVCVRLLGPVDAETRCGEPISFEKSKSLELLAWLTTHRERPTRIAARTALWEISVQDATFNNVVSGLRRSLTFGSDVVEPIEFLPKTFTDQLSIHGSVITDVDVLNDAVSCVKKTGDEESWSGLHDALDRVRDLPFTGTDYSWPDSEGITSNFILSVITSAVMAAEHALELGDTEGVFWATGQGLKVLHGHEELIALRMRAYGEVGDRAGVNAEWSSYERSLLHDSWSGGFPSERIVELKRELIG
jgi:hypothetical protein